MPVNNKIATYSVTKVREWFFVKTTIDIVDSISGRHRAYFDIMVKPRNVVNWKNNL